MDSGRPPSSADLVFRNPVIVRKILENVVPRKGILRMDELEWLKLRSITRVFKRECSSMLNCRISKNFRFYFNVCEWDEERCDVLINLVHLPMHLIHSFFKLMKPVEIEKVKFGKNGPADELSGFTQLQYHKMIVKKVASFPTPIRTFLNSSFTCPGVLEEEGACKCCLIAARKATEQYGPVQLNVVRDLETPIHWKYLFLDSRFFQHCNQFCDPVLSLEENLDDFEAAINRTSCDVLELVTFEPKGKDDSYPVEILKSLIKLWSVKKFVITFDRNYDYASREMDEGVYTKYFFDSPETSPDFRICDESSPLDVVIWKLNKRESMWLKKINIMGDVMIAAFNSFPCSTFVFFHPRGCLLMPNLLKFVKHVLSSARKKVDVVVLLPLNHTEKEDAKRLTNSLVADLGIEEFKTQIDCKRATELAAQLAEDLPPVKSSLESFFSVWEDDSIDAAMIHLCYVHADGITNMYQDAVNEYSFEDEDESEFDEEEEYSDEDFPSDVDSDLEFEFEGFNKVHY